MALTKTWDLRQFGLILEDQKRGEEEEKRKREKKRKRKRRRREKKKRSQDQRYGTTKLEYGSLVCMIIILHKPRVLLGFHLNPKIMESKVGKTLNSTIRI